MATLGSIFASRKWVFTANPRDPSSGEELWDALAVRPNEAAIVVECKGTFVQAASKYSGSPLRFFRGLSRKYGNVKGAALQQLRRGVAKCWASQQLTGFDPYAGVAEVFPVLVAQDPMVRLGPVTRLLSDRMQRAVDRIALRPGVRVWPLTVIGADGLELLRAVVEATGQPAHGIFKRFHRTHRSRMIPFDDFLESDRQRLMTRAARESINRRFHEVADATMQRFEAKNFGGQS